MERARLSAASEGTERLQLIAARQRAHLSLQEVGKRLSVSRTTVHRWEKKGDIPQPLHLRGLCDLFGMSAQALGFLESYAEGTSEPHVTPSEQQEAPGSSLAAFRRGYFPLRLLHIVWHWPSNTARYRELQQMMQLELEDNSMMHDEISRRDALRLLAALPLEYCHLTATQAVFTKPIPEILAHCAAGITACWELRRGKELAFADEQVSAYLPTLKAIVKTAPEMLRKAAADLMAQGLLLKSTLTRHLCGNNEAIIYAQQAEAYAETAGNFTLHILALRTQANAYYYGNHWEQALQVTEKAKYLLEEKPKISPEKLAQMPIPSLVYSYVYAGLATYYAYNGYKEDALNSLRTAHKTFFTQSANDPLPIWIDHNQANLALHDGLTHLHLGMQEAAIDSFRQINTFDRRSATIGAEALINQVLAEVSRDDRSRDMEWCIECWRKAIRDAKAVQSNQRFNEAVTAYNAMCAAWPTEKRIKELRELIVHW